MTIGKMAMNNISSTSTHHLQDSQHTMPYKLHFLIIGGGIAGLSCAIALRRVGHDVTVFEADSGVSKATRTGGCRMPPNLTKIYNHWGMGKALAEISTKSDAITMLNLTTSSIMGVQVWSEDMLKEARAEFETVNHHSLRQLLHKTAIAHGAIVCYNSRVVQVDPTSPSITLCSGETIYGDVVVGADGPNGVSRGYVMQEDEEEDLPGHLAMYNTTIPRRQIMSDPELATLYKQDLCHMYSWFGDSHAAIGFPVKDCDGGDFAVHLYAPKQSEGNWSESASLSELEGFSRVAEPRLRKLIKIARTPVRVPCKQYTEIEQWVHDDGKMVVIGDAVHQLVPGGLQALAMAVEDGAVLARLFSHLTRPERIPSFLWAFQDLRQPRCSKVRNTEAGNLAFLTLPPGDIQRYRDDVMRRKFEAGKNALDPDSDNEGEGESTNAAAEWQAIMEVFCYDAEDEADNWWVEWGLLRERAAGEAVPGLAVCIEALNYTGEESDQTVCL